MNLSVLAGGVRSGETDYVLNLTAKKNAPSDNGAFYKLHTFHFYSRGILSL